MKDTDLLKFAIEYCDHLDENKCKFLWDLQQKFSKSKGRFRLSPLQHKYLQSCYDLAIAKQFSLQETMQPDSEYFKQLAIKKKNKKSFTR